jgi:hypothetical protein
MIESALRESEGQHAAIYSGVEVPVTEDQQESI